MATEKGYYHPELGYWQTISEPSPATIAKYPDGTVEIPVQPSPDMQWNGSAWEENPDYASEALAAERSTMVVSRFQAKAALSAAGLLATAETVVSGADVLTQLAWAEAIEFRRNSPSILALQSAMSLTDSELDDLFRAAADISA